MSELSLVLIFAFALLVVLWVVYYMIRAMLKTNREHLAALLEQVRLNQDKIMLEKSLAAQKQLLPVRLQAYERLVLFLERISPASLVMRCMDEAHNARQLQSILLRNVREEFEHNNSQQLYVSASAWGMVKTAREEVVQLINRSESELKEDAGKDELARLIVVKKAAMIDEALNRLKSEVAELF
jgi:hypothetical protein